MLNPMEVIKVKLQASGDAQTSAADVARRVLRTDGILGFWAGACHPPSLSCHVSILRTRSPYEHATKLLCGTQEFAPTSRAPSWCVLRSLAPMTR